MPNQHLKQKYKNIKIHVISQTHWDREWLHSLEETKFRLKENLDKLLDIFDNNPEYKHFHLDSQTIALEDYLDLRPENKARLEKYIKSGRLLVGPWYCLPDEFIVNGESLVRNMVIGHKVAQSFGKVMKVGYNPFSFLGQNSQIAQIYNGFDIDTIIFYRGIGKEVGGGKDFYLEAADGSRVLNIRLDPNLTRMNFFYLIGRSVYSDREPEPINKYELFEAGRVARLCAENYESRDLNMVQENYKWNIDRLEAGMTDLLERFENVASTNNFIAMDGYDSCAPSQFTPKLIKEIKHSLGLNIEHSSMPKMVEAIKKEAKSKKLAVVKNEMRFKGNTNVGTMTARVYIKQQNRSAEFALQKNAEPFCLLANKIINAEYPQQSLLTAWKSLLSNQSHDSIGGCSSDIVHRDMEQRFRKTEEIAKSCISRAQMAIVKNINSTNIPKDKFALVLFNQLTKTRSEYIDCHLILPKEMKIKQPAVYSIDGKEVACLTRKVDTWIANTEKFGMDVHAFIECDFWEMKFHAENIPALGYKTYYISETETAAKTKPIKIKDNILENKYLKATINPNGTIDLFDKTSKRTMKGLHYFEDRADVGGPWNSGVYPGFKYLNSKKCQASITNIEESEFLSIREVKIKFRIPADVAKDHKKRSAKMVDLVITSRIILKKDKDQLEFETTVNNTAKSHMLRVMFPSGLSKAKSACAEGAFDVVERPIITVPKAEYNFPGHEYHSYNEHAPMTADWQYSFMDISDGKNGLGILNFSIGEYEVINDKERTVGLTLLRSFPRLKMIHTLLKADESQCLGELNFRYALVPHQGTWAKTDMHYRAETFNNPIWPMQFLSDGKNGKLPAEYSHISVDGAVVDAIKKAERKNSTVIRVHNPTTTEKDLIITCSKPIKQAYLCNLNEERRRKLKPTINTIKVKIPAKKIFTIEMS